MKQKIVVSNIRIPENDWRQAKMVAASRGMSVNEYIHQLITVASTRNMLGIKKQKRQKKKTNKDFFQAMIDLAKVRHYHPMGASEEDKIIYGIEDD